MHRYQPRILPQFLLLPASLAGSMTFLKNISYKHCQFRYFKRMLVLSE